MRLFMLLLFWLSLPTLAYQVQPMIVDLAAHGKKSLVTYRLQNPSENTLPIEIEVYKRTFDENQQEVLVPAEDDFIVLPPQVEVAANSYQVFRAKYLGSPELKETHSYRIVFKQLPLPEEDDKSGVKMVFNFATLVFVSPEGINAQAQTSIQCEKIEDCTFTIANSGKRVLDLSTFDYQFHNGETNIEWAQLQSITSGRFIMPGHKMEVDLQSILNEKPSKSAKLISLFNQK
ncbi:fimbrial biogenesis chaperone [Pseudoalteromonas luteoviolacea]|uniref:P pilus assembly protein chaperone PapD n=1 Tax=Pseudoalteromonas luteoviolacea H33 TaxID=1365251 RepID=A0A166ZN88_9GAMM|nr:fimbria/pilus periplasmic chaperone [Pseudoalteromonas luteoviolacea]KZN44489.1 p pilus assembly protein chaperone PapD [Pseudoalteromonas luteoviolacea H33]KZN78506.1 p pilus assembly protein chaperone PapD [Pseudoalteromonas luteoviolacea H33-S]MBQ4878018.1 molecular chaperone [Pseudoalteromonas luteoviolacea]MBQ4907128.1 molecular chaperone [Pseudoalteromonas luteoviolacea]